MTPAGTSNELDVQNEWEENTENTVSYTCTAPIHSNIISLCIVLDEETWPRQKRSVVQVAAL